MDRPPVMAGQGSREGGSPVFMRPRDVKSTAGEKVQLRLHVSDLAQLYNALDPSPFRRKDLDPQVEAYLFEWASEASRHADFSLLVSLDHGANPAQYVALEQAIREYFSDRAQVTRQQLHRLLRRGRTSLIIGIAALAGALLASELISTHLGGSQFARIFGESLIIGGWVAMWQPLEIFLYSWWPVRDRARLYDRLKVMPVHISDPEHPDELVKP